MKHTSCLGTICTLSALAIAAFAALLWAQAPRGARKQRLRIHPDLTGLYGATPVEKIRFDGDQVAFDLRWQFGDRTFETKFAGKLAESKLEGELTSERGATKVAGTKVVRAMRGRGAR
ncbi:MAG TPA: hypothetical protein P5555_14200 [Candidatus Paceibacterota bacterium]|nr:hypothetical protein [Verrucomicrobiota bacterium]HOX03480.1 hypothetical protein [Verrucomicrobiota bacterium]HRZ46337.1 hypothetical protein [Candidatus Paceibacterota bacterium]